MIIMPEENTNNNNSQHPNTSSTDNKIGLSSFYSNISAKKDEKHSLLSQARSALLSDKKDDTPKYIENKMGQNKSDEVKITPLRTYTSDIQSAISTNDISHVQMVMMEAKKQEKLQQLAEQNKATSSLNKKLIVGTIILLACALAVFVGSTIAKKMMSLNEKQSTALIDQSVASIVVYDKILPIEIDSTWGLQALSNTVNALKRRTSFAPEEKITFLPLYLTVGNDSYQQQTLLTPSLFLKQLNTGAPEPLMGALGSQMMLGLYNSRNSITSFLLFDIASYSQAWSSMLEWEEQIPYDIGSLFFTNAEALYGSNLTNLALLNLSFIESKQDNNDIRILLSADKKSLVYYSFIYNNHYLLIARERMVLTEVINRLIAK